MAQTVKRLPTMRENRVRSQGRKDLLAKGMATHSSILASSHLPTPKHGLKENSQQPAAKNFKRAMKSVQGCGQVMLYELTFTECLLRAKYCSKCYMNYLS